MNAIKYQELSKIELAKLTGGCKKWVFVDRIIVERTCVQPDDNGNCLVEWVVTRETWQRVNSKGEILQTEYRPD